MAPQSSQGRSVYLIVAISIFLIGAGAGVWQFRHVLWPGELIICLEQFPINEEDLVSQRSIGLGYLETDQPSKSLEAFEQLAVVFPEESLGLRNLAVARLMLLVQIDQTRDPETWQTEYDALLSVLEELKKLEPNSAEAHILQARAYAFNDQTQLAFDELLQAAAINPDDPAIRFELYELARYASDELADQANQQLKQAYQLSSNNLVLTTQWLQKQAENEDPEIVSTLTEAQKTFALLETSVQKRVRVSLNEFFASAIESAKSGDWKKTLQQVRIIGNVTRSEEAVQSDLLRLNRHPLEFIVHDFSPAFYLKHNLSSSVAGDPIKVSFSSEADQQLPGTASARDLALIDFNLDGKMDICLLNETSLTIYSNNNLEEQWQEIASLDHESGYHHLLAADLDADANSSNQTADAKIAHTADIDFVMSGPAGISVVENFIDDAGQRQLKHVALNEKLVNVTCAKLGDLDHDGDLDIFISSDSGLRVWSNADNLQFVPWGSDAFSGFDPIQTTQATVIDWDRDTDLDIVLSAYAERPAGILENLRHGRMRWLPFDEKFASVNQSNRINLLDADSNTSWDLLAASSTGINLALTQTTTQNKVLHSSDIQVDDFAANEMLLCDYDNDGLEDLFAYNEKELQVWRNLGNGKFAVTDNLFTEVFTDISSIKTADLDQDGDLDLIIAQPVGVTILDNQGGNGHHWIDITLLAQQVKTSAAEESGRVNQYGIGSLLELQLGASYQPRMVESPITHFGLGKNDQADVLRILWTNGIPHSLIQPQGNQLITEQQTLKGSCPYLYAWDGEQFSFVTDLLWAAPIGLQTATAEIMPDRPWEYLKISGEQLKPVDGEYRLQITEELWEAAYFDQVELIAVDHPGDVDIFTNEKVGPPFLAAHEIHTVKHPQLPVAAQDTFGQDILELLSEQDDQYVRAFHQKIRQGYTEPHFIELDLGDLSDAKKITLFLTGWIYPTDTSINVQLSQNSQLPGPRPPFITTPDAEGNWVETRGFMGFPGGKTKTIAVNISDVFAANDYRIRINTSSEIHWDAAFFTVDESAAKTVEHTAPLLSADLHTRGVSAPIIHPQYGPERYDYNQVITTPAWPAMQGNFTRFGDVTEVIRNADDQLVVISTGDEITLTFAAPNTPVPAGWKRDFVLHNIGWDKDADLNTINGQTVEPLPFRKMTAYPPPPFEQVLSLAYQRYLEIYQTRKQNHSRFQNAIRYHQYID